MFSGSWLRGVISTTFGYNIVTGIHVVNFIHKWYNVFNN